MCIRDRIYASNEKKLADRVRGISATNLDGHFVVSIRRATPFLIAASRRGKVRAVAAAPWSSQSVTMRAN